MFPITGRLVARRIPLAATQLFAQPLVIRPALAARAFTASPRVLLPAAKNPSDTTKTKKTSTKSKSTKPTKDKPKAKAKAKPKKTVKLVTAEEREEAKFKAQKKREKAKLREARGLSLLDEQPALLPNGPWTVLVRQSLTPERAARGLGEHTREMSAVYASMTTLEREALEDTARANRETNAQRYQEWIESHSPERIYLANIARRHLSAKTGRKVTLLTDSRIPKRPGPAYIHFAKERMYAGPEEGDKNTDLVRKISQEWNVLSDEEKAPYVEKWREESERHKEVMEKFQVKVQEAKEAALAEWEEKKARKLAEQREAREAKKADL